MQLGRRSSRGQGPGGDESSSRAPAEVAPPAPSEAEATDDGRRSALLAASRHLRARARVWSAPAWARAPLAVFALAVTVAYLVWRLSTVPVFSPLGWFFYLLELSAAISFGLFVFSTWDLDDGPEPGTATKSPSIAVCIATYDEDEHTLLPTVAAAVALRPVHETWVLDDGRRPWVKEMALAVGARYLSRPNNEHAKAGNLNNALRVIDTDLVAILDADHVPDAAFLEQTLPYFDDPRVAVVQTPQDFYNTDSFEHIGTYSEEGLFYRVLQPGKNAWDAAFWCGTSAVLRTRALRSVRGVATDSVTEDLLTTIRLLGRGWGSVFHANVLARGQAPATYEQYLVQRRRWAKGAMQVLRSRDNPWRTPNLTLTQRVAFTASLAGWFDGLRTIGYLAVALWTVVFGSLPLDADPWTFAVVHVLVFVLAQTTMKAIGGRHHQIFPALLFEFLRIPVSLAALGRLLTNGDERFTVTPKGRTGDERTRGSVPRSIWVVMGLSLSAWVLFIFRGIGLLGGPSGPAVGLGALALLVNAGLAFAAVSRIRDERFADERRRTRRFGRALRARLGAAEVVFRRPSLTGAIVDGVIPLGIDAAVIATREGPIALRGRVERTENGAQVFEFAAGQWAARAALARTLFADDVDVAVPTGAPRTRPTSLPAVDPVPERMVTLQRHDDPVPAAPDAPRPVVPAATAPGAESAGRRPRPPAPRRPDGPPPVPAPAVAVAAAAAPPPPPTPVAPIAAPGPAADAGPRPTAALAWIADSLAQAGTDGASPARPAPPVERPAPRAPRPGHRRAGDRPPPPAPPAG